MSLLPIEYEGPVFRPPSEARSLLIQVTIGCSFNHCTYCDMYRSKNFRLRSLEEIKSDLEKAKRHNEQMGLRCDKIFLCDGDALVAPADFLLKVLALIKNTFPEVRRVSCYATIMNVMEKKQSELEELAQAGLGLLYFGVESGSEAVLKSALKPCMQNDIITSLKRVREAGIKSSVILLIGLGGKKETLSHGKESAHVINQTWPDFLSFLVVTPVPNTPFMKMIERKLIEPLSEKEHLLEMKSIIEGLQDNKMAKSIFRANHVSNWLPLEGLLPQDRHKIIEKLDQWIQKTPDEVYRGPATGPM